MERVSRRGLCECRRKKRRGKPAAQSSKKQASFAELGVLPTIAKPASVVGEAIDVDGDFCGGSAEC